MVTEPRDTDAASHEARAVLSYGWVLAAPVLGALAGAIAGIVFTAVTWSEAEEHGATFGDWLGRLFSGTWWQAAQDAGLDWWIAGCAVTALVIALALLAWRALAWGVIGVVFGSVVGGIVGSAIDDDPSAPMDWGSLYGLAIGAAFGGILGLGWGVVTHVRHRRRISRPRS